MPKENIDVYEINKNYDYGVFKVSPIKLYHNVENAGYRLNINGEWAIYATDTNTLDGIVAKNYDLYMLEANYTDDEIEARIEAKKAKGEYAYECQVIHNHLSKAKCDDFIINNAGTDSQFVYLHQHKGDDCSE